MFDLLSKAQTFLLSQVFLPFLVAAPIVALFAATSGCNSNETQPNESSVAPSQEPLVADNSSESKSLVGIWLGMASLDQEQLRQKLNSIPDLAERSQLQQIAQSFLTTKMGAEFSGNGDLKLDLEILATNGQLLEGSSWGSWKLVKQTDDYVIIDKTENFDDGTSENNVVRYDFRQNKDQFEFVYPHPDLRDCKPMIVFQRQNLTQSPSAKIANQNGDDSNNTNR